MLNMVRSALFSGHSDSVKLLHCGIKCCIEICVLLIVQCKSCLTRRGKGGLTGFEGSWLLSELVAIWVPFWLLTKEMNH